MLLGLAVAACGVSHHPASGQAPRSAGGNRLIQIAGIGITGATYYHWMAIGAATVEMPRPGTALPRPITYKPPAFTACVDRYLEHMPKSTPLGPLRAECKLTYESIQARILSFLITGYWLRSEANARHIHITSAEVHMRFEEERRAHYPSLGSFRRLQEASHQTISDLEFATETQILSTRLFERFVKEHRHFLSEEAAVRAFNNNIKSKWITRTSCEPGYIVPDCKQYKPPVKAKAGR